MAEYDNTDRGVLFSREPKTDKHPCASGNAEIICPHCLKTFRRDMAAWLKESKGGLEYLSVTFSEPHKKESGSKSSGGIAGFARQKKQPDEPQKVVTEEDIPF